MKNSFSRYPYCDLYDASIAFIGMSGVPPVTGPVTVGIRHRGVERTRRRECPTSWAEIVGVPCLADDEQPAAESSVSTPNDTIAARIVTCATPSSKLGAGP